jgi:hypothetical protein
MRRLVAIPVAIVAAFLTVGAGPSNQPLQTAQANAPKQVPPKPWCRGGIRQRLFWFQVSKNDQGGTIVLFRGEDKSNAYDGLPEPPGGIWSTYPVTPDWMGRVTFTSLRGTFITLTPVGANYHVEYRNIGETDAKCN